MTRWRYDLGLFINNPRYDTEEFALEVGLGEIRKGLQFKNPVLLIQYFSLDLVYMYKPKQTGQLENGNLATTSYNKNMCSDTVDVAAEMPMHAETFVTMCQILTLTIVTK